MTHVVFPRIKEFTGEKIRSMIQADKIPIASPNNGEAIYDLAMRCFASAYSKADDEYMAHQQVDAWACASNICDSMKLPHQTKLRVYNELKAHQESIIRQIEGMNTRFYRKIARILSVQEYTRSRSTNNASLEESSRQHDPSMRSSTLAHDIECEEVSSPAKRGPKERVEDGQTKRSRVAGGEPGRTAICQFAGVQRSNNELDVDLNVTDFLASMPERVNTSIRQRQHTVVWDNEPSFDLGISPPTNLAKNFLPAEEMVRMEML